MKYLILILPFFTFADSQLEIAIQYEKERLEMHKETQRKIYESRENELEEMRETMRHSDIIYSISKGIK